MALLLLEVYTAERVSLFASSTTFPTDLIEKICQHEACKIRLTNLMLHHRWTETKAVYFVEDVWESQRLLLVCLVFSSIL